jgi:hypothetical protein
MLLLLLTTSQSFVLRVCPSTNVGAILATTYYDTQTDGLTDGETGQKHYTLATKYI